MQEQIATIREALENHRTHPRFVNGCGQPMCIECEDVWPCVYGQALAVLDALEREMGEMQYKVKDLAEANADVNRVLHERMWDSDEAREVGPLSQMDRLAYARAAWAEEAQQYIDFGYNAVRRERLLAAYPQDEKEAE